MPDCIKINIIAKIRKGRKFSSRGNVKSSKNKSRKKRPTCT